LSHHWPRARSILAKSGYDPGRLGHGLSTLSHQLRVLTLECLERSPAALLRVAKSLGTLSDPRRDRTIDRFEKHPLRAVRWEAVSPAGALKALDPFVRQGLTSPMPGKLREYLRGGRELTAPQVERCLKVLRDRVPVTLLEVLESLVEGALAEGVAKRKLKDDERHALRMLPQVKPNRRALRRLLMAHFRGEGDFIQRHPNSRRWFARHPRIDETGWRGGLTLEREIPKLGRVRIAVEREPLEALKLGTYVGSCLGLGGSNAYSAAAVVLDVNKQVLYARDRKGTVLARQLVAISEEEELVCFGVYPHGAPAALKRFFRKYDEAFAARLGLKLYSASGRHRQGAPGSYQIARIISTDWWDDGAWEFEVKSPTRGLPAAVMRSRIERPARGGRSS
jgi:hypothetical protein